MDSSSSKKWTVCPGKNVSSLDFNSIYVSSKATTGNYQTEYASIVSNEKCPGSLNTINVKIHYHCNGNPVYEEIEQGKFYIFHVIPFRFYTIFYFSYRMSV